MMTFTNLIKVQVFWVTGALERLATLGLLAETPYVVSKQAIDIFIELDEHRDRLFQSNDQMKELLSVMLKVENGVEDKQLLDDIFTLLKDYKDNREHIVKYALSQQNS